jgi:periplasmic copper chaperone A
VTRYLFIIACALTAPLSAVSSCEFLVADKGWVRRPPPGHSHVAAYAAFTNNGSRPLRITGVQSPDFESAMLHETIYKDGQARMRHIPAIDLAPGAEFRAEPGGAHVMLNGPRHSIDATQTITLSFECAAGGSLTISLPVRKNAPE